jgi:hypothetical protein
MPKDVLDIILSSEFWSNLKAHIILKPLDEALRMSESNHSTLAHVVPRWNTIVEYLEEMKTLYPSEEFELFMTKERDERLKPKGAFLTPGLAIGRVSPTARPMSDRDFPGLVGFVPADQL